MADTLVTAAEIRKMQDRLLKVEARCSRIGILLAPLVDVAAPDSLVAQIWKVLYPQDQTAPKADVSTDLASRLHDAWEWQYDECDHGTYSGGLSHGQPYAMCEILARRIMG